jgi:hypothetical protein
MAEAQGERNIQDISCSNTYSQVRMDYEAKKVYAPSANEFQIQKGKAKTTQSNITFNLGSGTRLSDIMSREIEVKRVIDTCLGRQSRFVLHTRQLAEQVSGRQRKFMTRTALGRPTRCRILAWISLPKAERVPLQRAREESHFELEKGDLQMNGESMLIQV